MTLTIDRKTQIEKPLLRWVGGKQRLIRKLMQLLPEDVESRHYVEPFLGGGSMFFACKPEKFQISDANADLVNCYAYIRDNPGQVYRYLTALEKTNTREDYYEVREKYNKCAWSYKKAAYFIYLNKLGFNGVYRVNTDGNYNVPFGDKENPKFPTRSELVGVSKVLTKGSLRSGCFRESLQSIRKGSFVFLDPPYPPLNSTAFFAHYTEDRFGYDDHMDLMDVLHEIDSNGAKFMMTNADVDYISSAVNGFRVDRLQVPRWVSCKGKKIRVDELVVRNY